MPATSHFNILGFKPENFENNLKVFISSLTDFWSLKKNVVSCAYGSILVVMIENVKTFYIWIALYHCKNNF